MSFLKGDDEECVKASLVRFSDCENNWNTLANVFDANARLFFCHLRISSVFKTIHALFHISVNNRVEIPVTRKTC